MNPTYPQIRLFQEIGRRLDAKGFIAANDGNLSLRERDGTFLVTARGARKGYLTPADVVRVDASGRLLAGDRPPSSECGMHLAVYAARPDLRAIVHAHPPVATAFSVAREPMDACILPEIILTLGSIPVAPYGTPGTPELGDGLVPFAREHDVILLANHGAVAGAEDLEEAYFRMERLEHTARILLAARLLGKVEVLPAFQVERLLRTAPEGGAGLPCRPAEAVASPETRTPGAGETGEGPAAEESKRAGIRNDRSRDEREGRGEEAGLAGESWGRLAALITEVLEQRGPRMSRKE